MSWSHVAFLVRILVSEATQKRLMGNIGMEMSQTALQFAFQLLITLLN